MAAEPRNEPRNVRKPATARKKRTLGTWVALGLSIVFALVGVVPMAFGILVRTPSVQRWAADKTSALIDRELHVAARYKVEIKPWPLSLVVSDLTVDATDGGSPFASAELVSVRPGIFSLFAGKLDLGQVQVTGARVRAVVREGKLVNLDARTKPSATKTSLPDDLPLSSISITDASLDLDLDGTLVSLREIDADLDKGERSYDIALRTGAGALTRVRPFPGRPDQDAVDEDQLCHFDARADIDDQGMTVRRLALVAAVDFDPDPGTRPPCDLSDGDWRKVDLRLSGVRIGLSNLPVFAPPASTSGAPSELPPTKLRSIEGMVAARVPVSLVHRFVPMAHATGALDLDVEARWSPENLLPIVRGKLRADTPGIDGKIFSSHFQGDVDIAGSVVRVTHIQARWANGDFTIPEVEIRPFDLGIPLEARGIVGEGVELEGLLRDLGAHPQAHVGWKLVRTEIPRFGGTIVPLSLEGPLASTTRDFGVYDRPARRPDRRRMVSVEGGDVKGLFTVRPGRRRSQRHAPRHCTLDGERHREARLRRRIRPRCGSRNGCRPLRAHAYRHRSHRRPRFDRCAWNGHLRRSAHHRRRVDQGLLLGRIRCGRDPPRQGQVRTPQAGALRPRARPRRQLRHLLEHGGRLRIGCRRPRRGRRRYHSRPRARRPRFSPGVQARQRRPLLRSRSRRTRHRSRSLHRRWPPTIDAEAERSRSARPPS